MLTVEIPVSGKKFHIIDTLTKKETQKAAELMAPFLNLEERLQAARTTNNTDEINKITQDIINKTPQMDTFIFNAFMRCVEGMTKEYFENDMRNIEALILFNQLWRASTEIPLELSGRSGSASVGVSPKTPTL